MPRVYAADGETCAGDSECLPGHTCNDTYCRSTCDAENPCLTELACVQGVCLAASWAYGAFGEWGMCSASCGDGVEVRTRQCLGNDGLPGACSNCGGECSEQRTCARADTCSYGAWVPSGTCGTSCNQPTQPYTRACQDQVGNPVACSLCGGLCTKDDVCACAACGDGTTQTPLGEQCDNGASNSSAACSGCCRPNCLLQRCGDAVVDTMAAEVCDDGTDGVGSDNSNASCNNCCRLNCTRQKCGDGIIDTQKSEVCDQGTSNRNNSCTDCCRTDCTPQRCGDSIVDSGDGETCDRGPSNSNSGCTAGTYPCCRTTCVAPTCGDGIVDTYFYNEQCDNGTATNSNSPCNGCCRVNCRPQRCGDLIVDTADGEECDDGNSDETDGCHTCKRVEVPIFGRHPSVGLSTSGLVALAWYDDGDGNVHGKWVAANPYGPGNPTGTAEIPFSFSSGTASAYTAIGMAPGGRIVLAWGALSSSPYVRVRTLVANGTSAATSADNYTSLSPMRVVASMQSNDRFVVAWEKGGAGARDPWFEPFDANGGSLNDALVSAATSGDQGDVSIALDNQSRAIVVWTGSDGSGTGILAQCFNAASTDIVTRVLTAGDVAVHAPTSGNQRYPAVAVQRAGLVASKVVVVWRNDPGGNLVRQRMNLDSDSCESLGVEELATASGGDTSYPSIAMDQNGAYVIVWADLQADAIFAQRYDTDGVAVWGTPAQVSVLTVTQPTRPRVALDPSGTGRFVVTWEDQGGSYVYLQRMSPTGARLFDAPWP